MSGRGTKQVHLHLVHSWGGGIERWVQDYSRADSGFAHIILKSFGSSDIPGERLALYTASASEKPAHIWNLASPVYSTAISNKDYRSAFEQIIRDFKVSAIFVSSFIGHSLDVLDTNLKTVVICHDYYPYCPAINIYFNGVCTECGFKHLQRCFRENPHNSFFPRAFASEWEAFRKIYIELVRHKSVTLVAPSDSVIRNLTALEPAFRDVDFRCIPHGIEMLNDRAEVAARPMNNGRLKIMIPGRLAYHKGLELLRKIYEDIVDVADIYLIGCGNAGKVFKKAKGIHVVAENYGLPDLPKLVSDISPDVGLLLSVWPETFSYTLSELMILQIPPLAMKVGSFEDRIKDGVNGFLVEAEKGAIIKKIRELSNNRHLLTGVADNLKNFSHRNSREMVRDYHDIIGQAYVDKNDTFSCRKNLMEADQSVIEVMQNRMYYIQNEIEQERTAITDGKGNVLYKVRAIWRKLKKIFLKPYVDVL